MKWTTLLLIFLNSYSYALVDVTVSSNTETIHRLVDITTKMHIGAGFFAELNKVICNLIYFEQEGIQSMHVDWTHQFFPYKDDRHENGWDLYFEPVQVDLSSIDPDEPVHKKGNCGTHDLHDQLCVAPWIRYDDYLPYRLYANEIIKKHIQIKPHILQEVESFYEKNMKEKTCIGVHVRYSTSHIAETPKGHPSLQEYCNEVNKLLNIHKDNPIVIFLASDSHVAINYFKVQYGNRLVYLETYRAHGTTDPGLMYGRDQYWITHLDEWHRVKPGYKGGLGALMDCLLLSKCDYFIHITSNVATFACFFNPYIKSIYLPHGVPFKHCRYRGNPSIRNKFLNPI